LVFYIIYVTDARSDKHKAYINCKFLDVVTRTYGIWHRVTSRFVLDVLMPQLCGLDVSRDHPSVTRHHIV